MGSGFDPFAFLTLCLSLPFFAFLGVREISGGDGRGGQQGSQAHFALAPGKYRIEVRYSSGTTKVHDITVGSDAVRAVIGQQ